MQIITTMKTIRKQLKHLALLFATLILLQSCVVYQGTNVSLEQAAAQDSKVKVKMTNNKTYHFKHIVFEQGKYYGVWRSKAKIINTPLAVNELTQVRLQDNSMSTILSIGIPVIILGAIVFIAASSGGGSYNYTLF